MKKYFIFLLSILTILVSSITLTIHRASANISEVRYENNAYQVHQVQKSKMNLFLGESLYNATPTNVQLKKSLRLKHPEDEILTMNIKYKNQIDGLYNHGSIRITIYDDRNQIVSRCIVDNITDDRDFDEFEGDNIFLIQCETYGINITIHTESFPTYFTIAGDEYLSNQTNFCIKSDDEKVNMLDSFMLIENMYSSCKDILSPTLGKYTNYNRIYSDGDEYEVYINYDNRVSANELIKDIVAYDFGDDKEVIKRIESDTYSSAITNNLLGDYSFDITSSDSSNNISRLKIKTKILDVTCPTLLGSDHIEVSYTSLNEDNELDLSKYVKGLDNYDGEISLDKSLYKVTSFEENKIKASCTDSSGNVAYFNLNVNVFDDVEPDIINLSSPSFYQYEIYSVDSILEKFNFDDHGGSGVVKSKVLEDDVDKLFSTVGVHQITIYCEDKYGNSKTLETSFEIKDGVGPVFFINDYMVSVTTGLKRSAEDIILLARNEDTFSKNEYEAYTFMDDNYLSNFDTPGTYKTKIACYKEDGSRDYYLIDVQVKKSEEKNVFMKIVNIFTSFFDKLASFLKYIWYHLLKKM